MALAKKGSRRITVDGHRYRWVVSPDDGNMVLVIESEPAAGQRLQAYFSYEDLWISIGPAQRHGLGPSRRITPGTVRACIEAGLARGWRPGERGLKPFEVRDGDGLAPLEGT